MTKDEFIDAYCQRSMVPRERLMARRVALPCGCGDESCDGWAMVSNDPLSVETHMRLYAPEEQEDR